MYWYWFVCGVLLILMEFSIPGFVICFFGISALLTGGIKFFVPHLALTWQLLIFAFGGVFLALFCRWCLPGVFRGKSSREKTADIDDDGITGAVCCCKDKITPEHPGKVELHGTDWNAVSDENIAPGAYCVVLSRDNLLLKVKATEK
ncbi:MAG: NfeD family protein [Lentisphaerae bacterium]|nr:NfeD family protein [Lentisphaerota bacterium]